MLIGYFDIPYNKYFSITGKLSIIIQEKVAKLTVDFLCPPYILKSISEEGITQRRLLSTNNVTLVLDELSDNIETQSKISGLIKIKDLGEGTFQIEKQKQKQDIQCLLL